MPSLPYSVITWVSEHRLVATAIFAPLAVSTISFISNPRRRVNILFLTISISVSVWLLAKTLAQENPATWVQITAGIGAILPLHLWAVTELIKTPNASVVQLLRRGRWWLVATLALVLITSTDAFLSQPPAIGLDFLGPAYHLYNAGLVGLYVALYINSRTVGLHLTRTQRHELHTLVRGGTLGAALVTTITVASLIKKVDLSIYAIVVVTFYSWIVYSITAYRVLDAKQILLVIARHLVLILFGTLLAYIGMEVLGPLQPANRVTFLIIVSASVLCTVIMMPRVARLFRLVPDPVKVRQLIFDTSRKEIDLGLLHKAFCQILMDWLMTKNVKIYWEHSGLQDDRVDFQSLQPVIDEMKQFKWVTPERLVREKRPNKSQAITHFVDINEFGALVCVEGSLSPLLVGVGIPASGVPYTYPLIVQLVEIAAVIESFYERSYSLGKAKEAERLASIGLMGANLVHEIRNPLISFKTFIHLLEKTDHLNLTRRFIGPIKEELSKIDNLTEQLLELSRPRRYEPTDVNIRFLLGDVFTLLDPEFSTGLIRCDATFCNGDATIFVDPPATKQVFINLLRNAIQALEISSGDKWIRVEVRSDTQRVECLVSDSGPGIPASIREGLFQPFRTTKANGFGLGLAICREILTNLNATITAESATQGRGATFRLVFPVSNRCV